MPRTDIDSLRMLVAVAAAGSLAAAGRTLGVSQQAVSSRLRHLESGIGVELVRRSARGSALTDAGAVVADWAAEVIAASDRFESAVAALRGSRAARLRVAASLTIAEHLLPSWLLSLRSSSRTEVELIAENSTRVIERVRERRADLGFIETPDIPSDLESRTIAHDELVVVVRPDHPWARRRDGIDARELAATPVLAREEGSGTRAALGAALAAHPAGLTAVPPAAVLPTTGTIRATALGGDHPAVLSILAVADDVRGGRLVRVRVTDLRIVRPLTAIWASRTDLAPGARELLEIVAARDDAGGREVRATRDRAASPGTRRDRRR